MKFVDEVKRDVASLMADPNGPAEEISFRRSGANRRWSKVRAGVEVLEDYLESSPNGQHRIVKGYLWIPIGGKVKSVHENDEAKILVDGKPLVVSIVSAHSKSTAFVHASWGYSELVNASAQEDEDGMLSGPLTRRG